MSSIVAAKISLEFTLRRRRPVTVYIYDTPLSILGSYSLIHRAFSFTDTMSGAKYKPSVSECTMGFYYQNGYLLSYTNAHNFITLYPGTPYIVDHFFRPRADDTNPMQPGCSYRMHIPETKKREDLWWAWGQKWQVLRWRWWPFGAVKGIHDFVLMHRGKEDLAEIDFVMEGNCVVDVTE